MTIQSLILIRGIPGSGKTTFAKQLTVNNHPIIHFEADQYFVGVDGIYRYDKSKIEAAHMWCQQQTLRYLKCNVSVVVSNTFIKQWELVPYTEMAEALNIPLHIITMEDRGWKSVHDVPVEIIESMKMNFEY